MGKRMNKGELFKFIEEDLEFVSKETWLIMIAKYLSTDDLHEMLDANELSPRFFEEGE